MLRISKIIVLLVWVLAACTSEETRKGAIEKALFGVLDDGEEVYQYTLTNQSGASASIINMGCIVTSIRVPDKEGNLGEVVLGFDSLNQYQRRASFGAIIGRYANRIANAQFELDGVTYALEKNNGPNNIHGGSHSFNRDVWEVDEEIRQADATGIKLKLISPDMDDGFPGQLTSLVTYMWTNKNELKITYSATTDKNTILNFTNHSYFNLANHEAPILDHELKLNSSYFLPVDTNLIPTGELRSVTATPFDFTSPKPVGKDIDEQYPQLEITNGYDHCWVIDDWNGELKPIGYLYTPESGRMMEVFTSEPGVQIYTANGLGGQGREGTQFVKRGAICLETQHFPDSPNQSDFPTTVLEVGEVFSSQTTYQFSVR